MSPRSTLVCILATTAPIITHGFTPPSSSSSSTMMHHQRTSSPLSATSTTLTEDMYPNLLSSASLCANDESCSIESANLYLKEIVHIQSGCAAGTLSGSNVCDDVLNVSAVVAELRDKIGKAGSDTTQQMDVVTGTSNFVGSLGLATLYTIATLVILRQLEVPVQLVVELYHLLPKKYGGQFVMGMLPIWYHIIFTMVACW